MNVDFNPQVNTVFTVKDGPQVRVTKTMLDNVYYQETSRANEKGCMTRVQFETWVTFGSIPDNDVSRVVDPVSPDNESSPGDRALLREIETLRAEREDLTERLAEMESLNASLSVGLKPKMVARRVARRPAKKVPKKTAKNKTKKKRRR